MYAGCSIFKYCSGFKSSQSVLAKLLVSINSLEPIVNSLEPILTINLCEESDASSTPSPSSSVSALSPTPSPSVSTDSAASVASCSASDAGTVNSGATTSNETVESIVIAKAPEALEVLPAASVAVAVME